MAYQVKRSARVEETLELLDEQGKVVESIHVSLDPDSVVEKVSRRYSELLNMQSKIEQITKLEDKAQVYEELGTAVCELFKTIFGEKDTERIVAFYTDNYIEMCRNIMPFITGVVIPQVRKISQDNRKSVMQSYNRKQRRSLGRKSGR